MSTNYHVNIFCFNFRYLFFVQSIIIKNSVLFLNSTKFKENCPI
nr:MAG TPA: hypothetical protein [Caudoviricetes sp.]